MLWNEKVTQLEGVFSVHFGEPIPARFRVPLYKGITGHAAGERKAMRMDDVRSDPRYVEFPNSEKVRSELVIPLTLQGRLIGILDLESINLKAFSAEHERMLEILASYIAIALENSRLYAASRENELRLKSDLETARDIQRQLLPQKPHKIAGLDFSAIYVPARELAGDFYDFFQFGDGRPRGRSRRRFGQGNCRRALRIHGHRNSSRAHLGSHAFASGTNGNFELPPLRLAHQPWLRRDCFSRISIWRSAN